MFAECEELRTKPLNQDTVPWNIRVQISQMLETWKINNSNFVETRAAKHVLESVRKNSFVTVTASCGAGKTSTLQYVALKLRDVGYDILPITNPIDIVRFYNTNKQTLFVFDDVCGTYSINQSDLNNWELAMERIKVLIQNKHTKIIVACRLQVYMDEKFQTLSIFKTCVCNLQGKQLCLSQTEKLSIVNLYLKTEATEIMQYCDLYDFFPLICKLYNDNPKRDIIDFFKNPFSIYEYEIDKLYKSRNNGKYCVLALCVMFNNSMKEQWLTDEIDTEIRKIIQNTCEACTLNKGTSRLVLLDELKTLEHTFIKKKQGVYTTIHNKIFDFLSFYFGKKMIHCLIKNGDSELIMQRCLLERKDDMDSFITIVPPKYHWMYMQRLIDDWSKDINKCTDDGASPLFVACQKNHKEIVKLLLDKKAVIHNGMDDATSPLLIAKKMNHTVIVRMLEENGASE
ncbi:uncharacterized protein LOC143048861 [Mytilus galloprovincialis]|uniref:uncharacterized protein LOC143048861 n=1 Tax=Mytilus galloprovincialis TaxID=29158 RepID=UPI003F7BAAB5